MSLKRKSVGKSGRRQDDAGAPMVRSRRRNAGFSLLEMLVAFSIMAFSLAMLYRATGGNVRGISRTESYQRAVVLGQSLLASHDAVPPRGWNGSGTSAEFSWTARSAPYPGSVAAPGVPPLYEVALTVDWIDAESPRQLQLFTLLPERRALPGAGLR